MRFSVGYYTWLYALQRITVPFLFDEDVVVVAHGVGITVLFELQLNRLLSETNKF